MLDDVVLFNPYDCGKCLDMEDSTVRKAIGKMNNKQVRKLKNSDVKDIHIRKLNNAGENFLTESGVYKLIFKSHKKEAEKFQDWVTDEVLPSIRKTGQYGTNGNMQEMITQGFAQGISQVMDKVYEMYTQLKDKDRIIEMQEQQLKEQQHATQLDAFIKALPTTTKNTNYRISDIASLYGDIKIPTNERGAKINKVLERKNIIVRGDNQKPWDIAPHLKSKGYTKEVYSPKYNKVTLTYTLAGAILIFETLAEINCYPNPQSIQIKLF